MRALLLTLFLAFSAFSQTIIVVRHAERAGGTAADVGLSEAGQCRAEHLAVMLYDAGITRIYTSEVARTQQTAAPLAAKLHLTPETVPAKDTAALLSKLRGGKGNALVVGHSNTVPEIVKELGAGATTPMADTEFDRMYVVTLMPSNRATVVLLRYPGCSNASQ